MSRHNEVVALFGMGKGKPAAEEHDEGDEYSQEERVAVRDLFDAIEHRDEEAACDALRDLYGIFSGKKEKPEEPEEEEGAEEEEP